MSKECSGGAVNVLGKAGHAGEHTHQEEQRHGGEIRGGEYVGRLLGEERKGRHPAAALQREPDDPNRHHRETDGHLHQDQSKQSPDPQCANHRRLQIDLSLL